MNILPQILDICSKNLIISNISLKFQKKLFSLFEKFPYHLKIFTNLFISKRAV